MERNSNDNASTGNTGQSGSGAGGTSGSSGYGATTGGSTGGYGGSAAAGGTGGMSGSAGSEGFSGAGGTSGASFGSGPDTATEGRFEKGKEAVTDRLGTAREKAGELKSTLADKLQAGAEKLRQRGQTGAYAGATGSGTAAVTGDDRMAAMSNRVAGGLQHTADWIREADVDSLRSSIETQVKEHPGRTLVIAAGIGYLLGKAFRR
jgi:hypothetical protein